MQNIQSYFTKNGWKKDLKETKTDFKDISILVRRNLGFSEYGFREGQEMTSNESRNFTFDLTAHWFTTEKDFQLYAMTHTYPLGPCTVGAGKDVRRFDDTHLFDGSFKPKPNYKNCLDLLQRYN